MLSSYQSHQNPKIFIPNPIYVYLCRSPLNCVYGFVYIVLSLSLSFSSTHLDYCYYAICVYDGLWQADDLIRLIVINVVRFFSSFPLVSIHQNQFIFTAKHISTAATSRYWYGMGWDGIRTCNAWLLPNFMNNFRNSTMRLWANGFCMNVYVWLRFKQTMDLLIAKAKSFLAFKQIILYMYLPSEYVSVAMVCIRAVDERPKTNPEHSSKAPFIRIGMCVRMNVCIYLWEWMLVTAK